VSALRGAAAAGASAALFGSLAVLGKLPATPPFTVVLWMNVLAGVAFLPFLLRHPVARRDLPLVAVIAVCGGSLAPVLYLVGLSMTSSVTAALLLTTEAGFTLLIAFALRERASPRGYVAMAGMLLLAVVVATNLDFTALSLAVGNLLIVAATLGWGIDNNVSRVLSGRNAVPALVAAKCLVASALLAVVVAVTGSPPLPLAADLPVVLVLGLLVHGTAIWMFYLGLREIGAMRTGAIFTLSAVVGAVAGVIVFPGQVLSVVQVAAGAGMIGLALVLSREARDAPAPENGNTASR